MKCLSEEVVSKILDTISNVTTRYYSVSVHGKDKKTINFGNHRYSSMVSISDYTDGGENDPPLYLTVTLNKEIGKIIVHMEGEIEYYDIEGVLENNFNNFRQDTHQLIKQLIELVLKISRSEYNNNNKPHHQFIYETFTLFEEHRDFIQIWLIDVNENTIEYITLYSTGNHVLFVIKTDKEKYVMSLDLDKDNVTTHIRYRPSYEVQVNRERIKNQDVKECLEQLLNTFR